MDLGLKGRIAFVTGASRGIGRAIALALGAEGVHLALFGRDLAACRKVAAEARRRHRRLRAIVVPLVFLASARAGMISGCAINVDTAARVIGQKLGEALGQPVVVENRPGGGSVIERLAVDGSRPFPESPAAFASFLRAEIAKWAGVVRRGGITPG